MSPEILVAASRLSDLLVRENAALASFDVPHATALLGAKTDAVTRFAAAAARSDEMLVDASVTLAAAHRLRGLADENRRLLERAIQVQGRVIGLIRKAAIRPRGHDRYGRNGQSENTAPGPIAVRTDI
jgi:hypothetical protein